MALPSTNTQYAQHLSDVILQRINWIAPKSNLADRCSIDVTKVTLQKEAENFYHFVIDGNVIRRKNKLTVSFNCVSCARENIIELNNLVSKINRNIRVCPSCNICKTYGDVRSVADKIITDKNAFEGMDDDFKTKYFRKLMKPEDYNRLSSAIVSFQNGKFANMHDIVYVPYFRTSQKDTSFEPVFYDKMRDTIEHITHVCCRCMNCNVHFPVSNIQVYRNQKQILCKQCDILMGPTKPKSEHNINGNTVTFKTKMEHKFVKYCNKHDVLVNNGPFVRFKHDNGEMKESQVAFMLPDLGIILDVYGNKEYPASVSNRQKAIESFAEEHKYAYDMLYPKNYVKMTRGYLKALGKTFRDVRKSSN